MWLSERVEPGLVHVTPMNDLVLHELSDDCCCGPSHNLAPNDEGPDGWLVIHHSIDGRELSEPDYVGG